MVCLYVEGNAFFQNYFDTSYVCLFSFQASANKLNNLLLTSLSLHIVQKN
jgi:hypothetical protein